MRPKILYKILNNQNQEVHIFEDLDFLLHSEIFNYKERIQLRAGEKIKEGKYKGYRLIETISTD